MRYLDDKNSKEEQDHWIGLSDFERERFERHADFLIDQGYMVVDPHTLAVQVAWNLRNSPQPEGLVYEQPEGLVYEQPEGLVYEDGSRARRAVD
jgi:hypothetical protein